MLTKVSNTSLMFNMNHREDKMLLMGSITIIRISMKMEFHNYVNKVIALVRTNDIMVYARGNNHE